MATGIKCKHCGWIIVRNASGVWVLPHSKFPPTMCFDGIHHQRAGQGPDQGSDGQSHRDRRRCICVRCRIDLGRSLRPGRRRPRGR